MDFKTYFYRLTPSQRRLFAERAGTTARYIQCHLLSRAKIPRPALMQKLASASGNVLTVDDLLRYFYQRSVEEVAVHGPIAKDREVDRAQEVQISEGERLGGLGILPAEPEGGQGSVIALRETLRNVVQDGDVELGFFAGPHRCHPPSSSGSQVPDPLPAEPGAVGLERPPGLDELRQGLEVLVVEDGEEVLAEAREHRRFIDERDQDGREHGGILGGGGLEHRIDPRILQIDEA